MDVPGKCLKRKVLLVYYSPDARQRLEAALQCQHLEVYPIDGRAPDAAILVRSHPAQVVIMDHSAEDVSVNQAVRQVGQMLPHSLVITMHPGRKEVELYRGGHRIGTASDLPSALRQHGFSEDRQKSSSENELEQGV